MIKEIYLFFLLLFVLFVAGIAGAIMNISDTVRVGENASIEVETYGEHNNNLDY